LFDNLTKLGIIYCMSFLLLIASVIQSTPSNATQAAINSVVKSGEPV
jgi:hypothetical protein